MRKHKEFAGVLILVAIVVSLFGSDSVPKNNDYPLESPTPIAQEEAPNLDRPLPVAPADRLAVKGCWLGMTKDQLMALHGKPSREHSQYQEYVQWDYYAEGLNIVLGPGGKIVTVEGNLLTLDSEVVCEPGTPLEKLEEILGPCRTPLEELETYVNASFSLDGQAVHVAHKMQRARQLTLTVDYSQPQ